MGVFQRDQNWYLDYYIGARRIREFAGSSKGAALRAFSVRQAEIAQGKFGFVSAASEMGFDVFVTQYLDLVSIHKRGYRNERYVARTLKEYMGKRRISEITF
jgi:hypothetical protein